MKHLFPLRVVSFVCIGVAVLDNECWSDTTAHSQGYKAAPYKAALDEAVLYGGIYYESPLFVCIRSAWHGLGSLIQQHICAGL